MWLVAAALIQASTGAVSAPPPSPPPPIWNPAARENRQLLPAFTLTTIAPVLDAIGARYERGDAGGVRVTFRNGRVAVLSLSSCETRGCKALSIQSFWKPGTPLPADRLAAAIEKFNQRFAFAKAYVTADGRPSLQRYLTADYGFIRGDLAVNLLVFADQAERLAVDYLEPLAKAGK
jgi:hypothetical protein